VRVLQLPGDAGQARLLPPKLFELATLHSGIAHLHGRRRAHVEERALAHTGASKGLRVPQPLADCTGPSPHAKVFARGAT